ncbi:MAG TPA: A/G-specific adenine glycosylase [Candidatus Paceibacterota bacterium]|nr:A/G-specific adenine glycosylase [Candidatus Paceibacterota bacterium]
MRSTSDSAFRTLIYRWYRVHGRHTLPWRTPALVPDPSDALDPYKIVVSEVMLQQTQLDRVLPYYHAFLKKFPTVKALARAPLKEVLGVWSGLGYNRRALFLHRCAKVVVHRYRGAFPRERALLQTLPGIGPYSAAAVAIFAYNAPEVCIETNVRTVYLHHFFANKKGVTDEALAARIQRTMDMRHPRRWYWALMDYGSFLKKGGSVVHRQSAHYKKQPQFKGSRRELRGKILRVLLEGPSTLPALQRTLSVGVPELERILKALMHEGVIVRRARSYEIP